MSKGGTIKNLKRDYMEDMMYFYGTEGRVRKGSSPSGVKRLKDPTESLAKEYAKESPIIKAWCGKNEFDQKVKEAKRFKKVPNKKAMELAKKLLNK